MDTALGVGIDSRGAKTGARDVNRALDSMGAHAKKFSRTASLSFKGFQNQLFSVKGAILTVVASLGIGQLVSTITTFEKINAALKAVTGSAKDADIAFGFIKEFTSTTPFQLEEVSNAFIKLNALGLRPGEEALKSYGDTASAMNASIGEVVQAVASATTGEFDSLKRFGVTARTTGDNVAFTFKGISTTVGKNAQEIEEYLIKLGQNNFSGAMIAQMDTLGGKISNLGDKWAELLDTIGHAGATGSLKGATSALIDGLEGAKTVVLELPKVFTAFFVGVDKAVERSKRNWQLYTTTVGYYWNANIDVMKEAFADFLDVVGNGLNVLPWLGDTARQVDNFAASMRESTSGQIPLRQQLNAVLAESAERMARIDEVGYEMFQTIDAQNQAVGKYVEKQNKAAAADRARIAAEKEHLALMKEGLSVTEALRTPLEAYEEELFNLNTLFQELAISQETLSRGSKKAKKDLEDALDKDKVDDMTKAIEHWGETFTQNFVDSVITGKFEFQDLVKTVLAGILEMVIQKQVVDPIVGIAGNLISSFLPGAGVSAGVSHRGGIVGMGGQTRSVDPSVFMGAPRMHGGGMAGLRQDEYATILQRNEEVLQRSDPRHSLNGGGAGASVMASITVNVDSSGSETTVGQSDDGQKGRELANLVKGVVVQELIVQLKPGGLLA